jgi:uncharacterized protein
MDFQILFTNLTNPTILFFVLGIFATLVKSDLEIPKSSSKFISLYLLFSIGFKGGQELATNPITPEILYALAFGIVMASVIPIYSFFVLKWRLSVQDSAAVAAAYGSVSAVTFVAASSFLEAQNIPFNGYMVAVMALMEAPAIIIAVVLMMRYDKENPDTGNLKETIHHAFTNGSVLLIVGSLLIGYVSDYKQAEGIKPFTTDIFKGFLAIFLLEMGMLTAKRFGAFKQYGFFAFAFAVLMPLFNGCLFAYLSGFISQDVGNRLIFAILAASASYIAVPAAMRLAAPKADPGLYIPMALGLTFPVNLAIGMPLYLMIVG